MTIAKLRGLQGGQSVRSMTLEEFLEGCKTNPGYHANAHERMLVAIGEPEVVEVAKADERIGRIFPGRRNVRRYAEFNDFHGMEVAIEQLVAYFRHGAQGLEERKQVLYLLGPVGGGKSSLAERLKTLMEKKPIYVLAVNRPENSKAEFTGPKFVAGGQSFEASPVFESPLGLFTAARDGETLEKEFGIPRLKLVSVASPWAIKRLNEMGDISQFFVLELWPSQMKQIAIAKVEPGDENNQDVSALIGRADLRKLERYSQSDADAYGFAGGLNRANQGMLEFVEMFKAPIKMLHPLLTATQEGNYAGTDNVGMLPFHGIILAHSNETEWLGFRNNRNNEAFLDRICVVKVPYCLRVQEEESIYRKVLAGSELAQAPCAPGTLELLAQFCVLSRLKPHENSSLFSKLQVYNGADVKGTDPHAKTLQEYVTAAGLDEGMAGLSTRFAFKVLSATFNYDTGEIAADPVVLIRVLQDHVERLELSADRTQELIAFLRAELIPRYAERLRRELQAAYLDSFADYGQNKFDRYVQLADAWVSNKEYVFESEGLSVDRPALDAELQQIEKPAGIANPKDFRNEVVNFVLRHRANNGGKNPVWSSYAKMKEVIEKQIFATMEDLLPVLSFDTKKDAETSEKHRGFVSRMKANGFTEGQVRRLVEWYMRLKKA